MRGVLVLAFNHSSFDRALRATQDEGSLIRLP